MSDLYPTTIESYKGRMIEEHARQIRYCHPQTAAIHLRAAKALGEEFGIDHLPIVKRMSRYYEENLWRKQDQAKKMERRPAAVEFEAKRYADRCCGSKDFGRWLDVFMKRQREHFGYRESLLKGNNR